MQLVEVRKAAASLLGVVAGVVSAGLLHGQALTVAEGVLAAATVLGVYVVPNSPSRSLGVDTGPGTVTDEPAP